LEEYKYTGKDGRPYTAQIVITVKLGSMTANIDFKDAEQYENFICPEWLTIPEQ